MVILSSTLSGEMIVKEVCIPRILTEVNLEVEVIYPMQKITRTCSGRLIIKKRVAPREEKVGFFKL